MKSLGRFILVIASLVLGSQAGFSADPLKAEAWGAIKSVQEAAQQSVFPYTRDIIRRLDVQGRRYNALTPAEKDLYKKAKLNAKNIAPRFGDIANSFDRAKAKYDEGKYGESKGAAEECSAQLKAALKSLKEGVEIYLKDLDGETSEGGDVFSTFEGGIEVELVPGATDEEIAAFEFNEESDMMDFEAFTMFEMSFTDDGWLISRDPANDEPENLDMGDDSDSESNSDVSYFEETGMTEEAGVTEDTGMTEEMDMAEEII